MGEGFGELGPVGFGQWWPQCRVKVMWCVCGGEGGGYETNTATEGEACRIVYMRLPSEVLPTVAVVHVAAVGEWLGE